ncbi:hypothetical protein SASPL_146394 [Salvia splendens]|uniref:Thioredoxin domain-containing protein n=1 Tax=Salvia splendens TaxID=180675 RepID=A0A8X8WC26_SALSN|nr:hypothetical protein SASPL_146394 [Salvia splendens]
MQASQIHKLQLWASKLYFLAQSKPNVPANHSQKYLNRTPATANEGMRGASVILRRLVGRRAPCLAALSSSIGDGLIVSSAAAAASYSTLILAEDARPLLASVAATGAVSALHPFMNRSRNFSSAASSEGMLMVSSVADFVMFLFEAFRYALFTDSSNVVSIESEEQFNDSVRKAVEESQAAIFYFTAAWCGPCRLLSPMLGQLTQKYPHVTTYKIDIDKNGLENAVSKSNIHSVVNPPSLFVFAVTFSYHAFVKIKPTLHFFKNGKKADEVIGADVELLKDTMEALYNTCDSLARPFNQCLVSFRCASRSFDDPQDYRLPVAADVFNLEATLQGRWSVFVIEWNLLSGKYILTCI